MLGYDEKGGGLGTRARGEGKEKDARLEKKKRKSLDQHRKVKHKIPL